MIASTFPHNTGQTVEDSVPDLREVSAGWADGMAVPRRIYNVIHNKVYPDSLRSSVQNHGMNCRVSNQKGMETTGIINLLAYWPYKGWSRDTKGRDMIPGLLNGLCDNLSSYPEDYHYLYCLSMSRLQK